MPFNNQNGHNVENGPFGGVANPANVIILTSVPPSTAATEQAVGTFGIYPSTGAAYLCVKNTGINGAVTWAELALSTGALVELTGDSGGIITPSAGNISLLGTANQITTTGTANTITWSLPAALTAPGSVTATTTLTATLGNITATNGNVVMSTIGNGLSIKSGSNARIGQATLTLGTVTVANTSVTANSRLFISRQAVNGSTALGELTEGTVSVGTSFVIYAATVGTPGTPLAADVSTVNWMLVESA